MGVPVKETDALVSQVDILPTLTELNGLTTTQKMDGQSLLPLIAGKQATQRPVFVQYDGNGALGSAQRCILKGNYKLIADMFKNETYLELYDVVKDPSEKVNLVFDKNFATTADEMLQELTVFMKNSGDRFALPDGLRLKFLQTYTNGIQKSDNNEK